jgi:hypothetical protein
MVARVRKEPNLLTVTVEHVGEQPQRITVDGGHMALVVAVGLLMVNRELRPGDKLTVSATD